MAAVRNFKVATKLTSNEREPKKNVKLSYILAAKYHQ
jgi:hypothetical protein